MKIISLNIWGAKVHDPFIEFVKNHDKVDVFCFQEIYSSQSGVKISKGMYMNIYDELKNILSNYQSLFGDVQETVDNDGLVNFDVKMGQATFIKNDILVEKVEHFMIHGKKNSANKENNFSVPGGMLCTKINSSDGLFTICNIHGAALPGDKLDNSLRLEQSKKIKHTVDIEQNKGVILCGDFNLLPTTKSIGILSENMQNLIKDFNIERTRSAFSPYFQKPDEQKFADYAFLSPDIKIKDFKVLDDQVSDHLALYIEF
ncbi:MAG: endonuclease/exonuclease/phosphatase family protein [Candidatus Staskawiczbacteria bacterium]|nr:endonuclease/exonuclease/phosphatase family protein [Candidatus Staskawiczbacteria bacterium]